MEGLDNFVFVDCLEVEEVGGVEEFEEGGGGGWEGGWGERGEREAGSGEGGWLGGWGKTGHSSFTGCSVVLV